MIILLSMILWDVAVAQDPHFSQFFSSPLTLNPAFTGRFSGNFRVTGNYKNQWQVIEKAFVTSSLSLDFQLPEKKDLSNDSWGIGVSFYTDKSADGALNSSFGNIGIAYHKQLDEDGSSLLSSGFQLTYANSFINTSRLTFEDQLITGRFIPLSSETFSGQSLNTKYVDLSAGLVYSGSYATDGFFYFGVSAYHINKPKVKYTEGIFLLGPRITVSAGTSFSFSEQSTLHFSTLYSSQLKTREFLLGGAIERILEKSEFKPISIYLGSWIRFEDAIIPYLGFQLGNTRFGISYDINYSKLKTATYMRGGVEISLTHVPLNSPKGIKCPKF